MGVVSMMQQKETIAEYSYGIKVHWAPVIGEDIDEDGMMKKLVRAAVS
jgi:hypothetical protein